MWYNNGISKNVNLFYDTTIIRSRLCDYGDANILVKATITVSNTAAAEAAVDNASKKVVFSNCPPFANCITEINNTQVDYAEDIGIVMPMYILTSDSHV